MTCLWDAQTSKYYVEVNNKVIKGL